MKFCGLQRYLNCYMSVGSLVSLVFINTTQSWMNNVYIFVQSFFSAPLGIVRKCSQMLSCILHSAQNVVCAPSNIVSVVYLHRNLLIFGSTH